MADQNAYLILSTGEVLTGKFLGNATAIQGEVVFNTSMIGYQEVMSDPSYEGQLVCMTYPLIGNYGMNDAVLESEQFGVNALIVSSVCHHPDHPTSTESLETFANKKQIPVVYDLDTRHLTKLIRKHGSVFAKISTDPNDVVTESTIDPMLVSKISLKTPCFYPAIDQTNKTHLALIDYGQKHSIIDQLLKEDVNVTVYPHDVTLSALKEKDIDGVLFSNGPGDPKNLSSLLSEIKQIADNYPTLGICLGHQALALAYGCETKKLKYGHRGGNHPVKHIQTGKVSMTSQNHGYGVEESSVDTDVFDVSYINVNDGSVEGLKHKHKPIQSIQFHPEASPGPQDTAYIIKDFITEIKKGVHVHA